MDYLFFRVVYRIDYFSDMYQAPQCCRFGPLLLQYSYFFASFVRTVGFFRTGCERWVDEPLCDCVVVLRRIPSPCVETVNASGFCDLKVRPKDQMQEHNTRR